MAKTTLQTVMVEFDRVKKDHGIDDRGLKDLGGKLGSLALDLCRRRTATGVDVKGNGFPQYSKGYPKKKLRYINGKRSKRQPAKTAFAAKKVRDVTRVSGRTWADMAWKSVKVQKSATGFKVQVDLGMKNTARPGGVTSAEIVEYLREMGYDFFGLAKAGPYRKKEQDAIKALVKTSLRLNRGASGSVSTK
jgi:hypothetical protein